MSDQAAQRRGSPDKTPIPPPRDNIDMNIDRDEASRQGRASPRCYRGQAGDAMFDKLRQNFTGDAVPRRDEYRQGTRPEQALEAGLPGPDLRPDHRFRPPFRVFAFLAVLGPIGMLPAMLQNCNPPRARHGSGELRPGMGRD